MKTRTGIALAGLLALSLGLCPVPGEAQSLLQCGPFTQEAPTPPRPRENGHARERFEQINSAVKTQLHRVLFLGDSLTEHFDPDLWRDHMAPVKALAITPDGNTIASGDRGGRILLWQAPSFARIAARKAAPKP